MDKNMIRLEAFNFLSLFGDNIKTKLTNICGKTGQYDVPAELFQKRTSRKNRVLLPWKTVRNNNLTMKELNSFSGGVVVEFVNEDYFDNSNLSMPVFLELKNRLGGNDTVSSMISIRSESGSSSSQVQRNNFEKLINKTHVLYQGIDTVITKDNYMDYAIHRESSGGVGNDTWSGFLFVSIRGGQQDTIETHRGKEELLFNPACEFASEDVCLDLDLVVSFFALNSITTNKLDSKILATYNRVYDILKNALLQIEYDSDSYSGNLYDYCVNHPCMKLSPGELYDPIQVEPIRIEDFGIKDKEDPRNLDFTHDEAVNIDKYYWDRKKNCILSPARPTNIFWSKHLSNMMQQNFSLRGYFDHEEAISKRRKELLNR